MPANAKSKLTMIAVLGAILVAALLFGLPFALKQLGLAAMSEVAANGRSTKLIMDTFAMDNDGVYPSSDTAEFYDIPTSETSNDLFKQLFASGNTNSEKHFWVKGAATCSETKPDDRTTSEGMFDPSVTLTAGNNGWSYFTDLTNTDNPDFPLIVASYSPGTDDLDEIVFSGKSIAIQIDGSASLLNTDGTTPGYTIKTTKGNALRKNTTAILNQPSPDGSPLTLLHPLSATP